jgi:hypothetical protein
MSARAWGLLLRVHLEPAPSKAKDNLMSNSRFVTIWGLVSASLVVAGCGSTDTATTPETVETQSQPLCSNSVTPLYSGCQSGSTPALPYVWPGRTVAYSFTQGISASSPTVTFSSLSPGDEKTGVPDEQGFALAAMRNWGPVTANVMSFVARTTQPVYVTIHKDNTTSGTGSNGATSCTLAQGSSPAHCTITMHGNGPWQLFGLEHELGHSMGLYHQQQRFDRDRYLVVNEASVGDPRGGVSGLPSCANPSLPSDYNGTWSKCLSTEQYGSFDFSSVMLYGGAGISGALTGSGASYTRLNGSEVCGYACAAASTVCNSCSPGLGPSYYDGSAVLETSFVPDGWKPLVSLGFDTSSGAQPLATDLDPTHVYTPQTVYAQGRVSPFYIYDTSTSLSMRAIVRGADNQIWMRTYSNGAWTGGWNRLNIGVYSSDPAGVSWGTGRIDIVGRGIDNNIYQTAFQNGNLLGQASLGAPNAGAASAPAISSRGSGVLDVFVIGGDGSLYVKSWVGSQQGFGWTLWTNQGNPGPTLDLTPNTGPSILV